MSTVTRFPTGPLPITPAELARDPRFASGWHDSEGRNPLQVLIVQVGEDEAKQVWRRAVELFEDHHGRPGQARLGAPLRGVS